MAVTPQVITALFDDARRAFPGPALDRLEHALTGMRVTPDDPMQRPGFLFLPFLGPRPWHEPPIERWVDSFEREYEAVRQ